MRKNDKLRIKCESVNYPYYTLQLFYALWLVKCMQINATITQSTDNSVICKQIYLYIELTLVQCLFFIVLCILFHLKCTIELLEMNNYSLILEH